MFRNSMLVVSTIATLVTGHASRAQTVQLDASTKMGRQVICNFEWQKIKLDPVAKVKEAPYGHEYFISQCKQKLLIKSGVAGR